MDALWKADSTKSDALRYEPSHVLISGRLRQRVAFAALTIGVFSSSLSARGETTEPTVTAVSGPSWLERLDVGLEETAMGHTADYGPPPVHREDRVTQGVSPAAPKLEPPDESVRLTGVDIYRLSCQGCHRADGRGALPEIKSIIDPVRATSTQLTLQKMKARGISMKPAFAEELAAQAEQALLERLENGGERMPSFAYLSRKELEALQGALDRLAGVPGSEHRETTLNESPSRVGELLVKGTCHICHDAAGSWPDPQELLKGAIPPLSSLVERDPPYRFIRKVRSGEPIAMGEVRLEYRGRMPVFHYLNDQEVFAAYLYLVTCPPKR